MEDIDEGIGSNDSADGKNMSMTKAIDHWKALNQLKRLNGESVTTKLCNSEHDQAACKELNGSHQNGEVCMTETLANGLGNVEPCVRETLANSAEDSEVCVSESLANGTKDDKICVNESLANNTEDDKVCVSESLANGIEDGNVCLSETLANSAEDDKVCVSETSANGVGDGDEKTEGRVPLQNMEDKDNETSPTSDSAIQDVGEKEENNKFNSVPLPQEDDIENSETNKSECNLNGTGKFSIEESEKNNKIRLLLANAKNSLKRPTPVKKMETIPVENKPDTENSNDMCKEHVDLQEDVPDKQEATENSIEMHETAENSVENSETAEKHDNQNDENANDDDDVIFDGESTNIKKLISSQNCADLLDETATETLSFKQTETVSDLKENTKPDARNIANPDNTKTNNESLKGMGKVQLNLQNGQQKEKQEATKPDMNVEEDDDDDVIFEGESKAVNEPDNAKPSSPPVNLATPVKADKEDESKTDTLSTKPVEAPSNSKTDTIQDSEDDDDVIFEKETKIDLSVKDLFHKDQNKFNEDSSDIKKKDEKLKSVECDVDKKTNPICDIKDKEIDVTIPAGSDSKSAIIADRKRPADESILIDSDSKRSKLEPVVKALKVAQKDDEPTSIDLIDSDEEEMDISEPLTNGVPNHKDTNLNGSAKVEVKKMITLSEQELDTLIRSKLKACLAAQRDTLLAQMSQKLQHFQTNNDLWKRQVKDLQVKVNEATVLQQKHEKRKAHTAALRQITTRNVAVQVDDGRTSNAKNRQQLAVNVGSPNKPVSKSTPNVTSPVVTAPPGANGMIRLPIPQSSLAPPMMPVSVQQSQMVTSDYKTPTVKSLLDTTRTQPTISSIAPTSFTSTAQVFNVQYPQRVVTHTTTTNSNFISLSPQTASNISAKLISKPGGTKIIDLTDDEPRVMATSPQALTTVNTSTGVRALLSQGSQFVRASFPNSPGTFQLVFPPGTQPLRPGTMITGLPQTMIQAMPQIATSATNTSNPNQSLLSTPVINQPPSASQTPAHVQTVTKKLTPTTVYSVNHPAPFPQLTLPQKSATKSIPPKPNLRVSRVNQGIVLSWNMTMNDTVADVQSYQLFAYQETSAQPQSSLWKKVGDVKALPLPMACTLTQFQVGNKYHFAVRALDVHGRVSDFSDPSSLHMLDGKSTD